MKLLRIGWFSTCAALGLCAWAHSASSAGASSRATPLEKAFLGRWDLTLKAPDREYPSWLELSDDGGQLKAQMVGRWGSARPLPKVELSNGRLTFVSPKEEEGSQKDVVFEGRLSGQMLSGTLNGPDGKTWQWSGQRAPSLKRTREPKWGKPIPLFDGKDLSGWRTDRQDRTRAWKVENGALVSPGNGPELINNSKFEDFKLHVEFNCGENSNSGVYLRGRYEVQVETDSIEEPPSHHTGGIYGFIAPSPEQPRTPGKWQTFDITLVGRTVTVVQNGQTIVDHKEIPGITGGALDSDEGMPGPIYLQGSEKGHVLYRSIVVRQAEKSR
jgi:3-keto-disaccharide hydrolase